jgi:NAD(P)H dehydrogenase (quinone)
MVTFGQSIREGYFNILSDSVLKLTGRAPRSLQSVLEQYQHTWPKAGAPSGEGK